MTGVLSGDLQVGLGVGGPACPQLPARLPPTQPTKGHIIPFFIKDSKGQSLHDKIHITILAQ